MFTTGNIPTYTDSTTTSFTVGSGSVFPMYRLSNSPQYLTAMQTRTYTPADKFVTMCNDFKNRFKKGDIVQGVIVNGNDDDVVWGKIHSYKFDTDNKRIRVFVEDDMGGENELKEVYPETLYNQTSVKESLTIKLF